MLEKIVYSFLVNTQMWAVMQKQDPQMKIEQINLLVGTWVKKVLGYLRDRKMYCIVIPFT